MASRGHSGWVAAAAFFDENCRHALTLRAWEAVSTERHLQGVLEAVSEVLLPVVAFKWLGIVWFDGVNHDLYAVHGVDHPRREGETLDEFLRRPEIAAPREIPAMPLVPYPSCEPAPSEAADGPYTCADLYAKEGWFEHEFHLAAAGIRAYASIPLLVRDERIGAAVFSRTEPVGFTGEQVALLEDVSRALAVAVSNAIANEEIRKLRSQLEAENVALRIELGRAPWFEEIVGDSPVLRRVLEDVEQVASTDATVLITGETGTGKELIARALHRQSPRADGPLVKVNCAAIPETLLASELFGHERGAFTGATERRKGKFEQADGGTLFLDEVGEMSPEAQVMLLRVLQERELERLGGSEVVRVDVRLVAATNRDLEELVRAGRFRSDLYYRLSVFPIRMPPLRERPRDIPLLVAHFAAKHGKRFGRDVTGIDVRTLDALGSHDWPGNVRELENLVERSVILSRNGTITLERGAPPALGADALTDSLRVREREAIEEALRTTRGRVSGPNGAAIRLGLPPSTLEFRIKRLGIDKYRFRHG